MSYIRSTSNPEGLYIWADEKEVSVMKGSKIIGIIPVAIFNGLIRKYYKSLEDCAYKGAEIREIKSGKNFKTCLTYNNWKCVMWEVTWSYIVLTNIEKLKSY